MQELKLFQDKRKLFLYKLFCRCIKVCFCWLFCYLHDVGLHLWSVIVYIYTPIFNCHFRAEHLSLIVLPRFRLQRNNFTCPVTQNLTITLQNQPWYTRRRPSGFLTRSSNQSKSPQIKQIRRSIFLSSSLRPALCVEMQATPTLRLVSVCT